MKIYSKVKNILFLFSVCLLIVGCGADKDFEVKNAPKEDSEIKPVEMYIATDVHYISNSINDGGKAFQEMIKNADGRQVNYISELTEAFEYEIIENRPEVLIISGDLTHNGEKQSHLDLAEKFKNIEANGTEVYVIPGNHDINNPFAREFKGAEVLKTETITPKDFEKIYKDFGYKEAISRDKETLSYLVAPSDDLWLLMLDTSLYKQNKAFPYTNGKIMQETLEWIKKISEKAKAENVEIVTVMHHNLYEHSELLYQGYVLDNADEVLPVFKECDLNIVLSGHIHIQDIMSDLENKDYDIVTSGFIIYPIQYGILNFDNSGLEYHTKHVDVEKWASDNNIENSDLLNFEKYSKEYFYNSSYYMAYNELVANGFDKNEAKEMADVVGILNVNYFGGTTNDVRGEVLSSKGYDLWLSKGSDFLRYYVEDMVKENEIDNNSLKITAKK